MNNKYIVGSGGGGGGSSSSATEDPNTLRSISYVKIIDLLGEGEWEEVGIGGLKGIYLDGIPIQNSDGSYNYSGVTIDTRTGTLGQSRMAIADTTESIKAVGTEVRQGYPVSTVVDGDSIDIIRVTIEIPALSSIDTSSGDIHGTGVDYTIEYNSSDDPTYRAIERTVYTLTTFDPLAVNYTGAVSYNVSYTVTPSKYVFMVYPDQPAENIPYSYSIDYSLDNGSTWVSLVGASFGTEEISVDRTFTASASDVVKLRYSFIDLFPDGNPGSWGFDTAGSVVLNSITGYIPSQTTTLNITGKTTSTYEKQHSFRVTGTAPYTVRVTRLTADSTSSYLNNKTIFSAVAAVTEEKFRYPGSVLVGLSVDASQFSSIPSRAFLCKMLRIKVPTNYDPATRLYTGVWDGSFKIAWSDNPAWCFYDLLTNTRYGLGERIPAAYIDKFALYEIAQYCDGLVPDGQGGYEPRFTCNLYIQTQQEAYKLVSDLATVFRGITYWGNGNIVACQDSLKQPIYAFNNTNVVDGNFTYQSSDVNTRYNAVNVTWNDPNNLYKQAIEYVEDTDSITSLGYVNATSIVAFGCTSRGMARRVGKWLLYTNTYETDAVTFTVGPDGAIPRPGDIIQVFDNLRATERRGGRVKSYTSSYPTVVLDAPLTFSAGVVYTIATIDVNGAIQEATFTAVGEVDTINLSSAFPNDVAQDSIYIITDDNIPASTFRVVSIIEKDKFSFEISAVTYNSSKYSYVERKIPLVTAPVEKQILYPVTDLVATEIVYIEGKSYKSKIVVSWKPARFAKNYTINVAAADGRTWTDTTTSTSIEFLDCGISTFNIEVFDTNVLGQVSQTTTISLQTVGRTTSPSDITGLSLVANGGFGVVSWNPVTDVDVATGGYIVIKYTDKTGVVSWSDGAIIAKVPGSSTQAIVPLLSGTYMAKALDYYGYYSKNPAYVLSNYAEVQNTNVVDNLIEAPTFLGVKDNCYVDSGKLVMSGRAWFDSPADFDSVADVDIIGEGSKAATYYFSDYVDLTAVYTVRIYSSITSSASIITETINSRLTPVKTWTRFSGTVVDSAMVSLKIATTLDDPASPTAVWSDWSEFVITDYTARGIKFKLDMSVEERDHMIEVSTLSISVDAVDRVLGENNISVPATGFSIVFDGAFATTPAIAISIDEMQTGDYYRITSKSAEGFTAQIFDSSDTPVARQIDWIAKGWGKKIA